MKSGLLTPSCSMGVKGPFRMILAVAGGVSVMVVVLVGVVRVWPLVVVIWRVRVSLLLAVVAWVGVMVRFWVRPVRVPWMLEVQVQVLMSVRGMSTLPVMRMSMGWLLSVMVVGESMVGLGSARTLMVVVAVVVWLFLSAAVRLMRWVPGVCQV